MLQVIGSVLGAVILIVAALGVVYVVGMRRKSPVVVEAVRRFSRRVVNPRMLQTAGRPGAYASVIHHTGRTSGREYRTPVVAAPTEDGFVIALPYGTTSNWVRNVLASGSATIDHEGAEYRVEHPELVPLALVNRYFPVKEQRGHVRFAVDRCLRLRRVGLPEPSIASGAGRSAR